MADNGIRGRVREGVWLGESRAKPNHSLNKFRRLHESPEADAVEAEQSWGHMTARGCTSTVALGSSLIPLGLSFLIYKTGRIITTCGDGGVVGPCPFCFLLYTLHVVLICKLNE